MAGAGHCAATLAGGTAGCAIAPKAAGIADGMQSAATHWVTGLSALL